MRTSDQALHDIAALARPLRSDDDLDPLVDAVGDARFVLLGEASHGTAEYYRWRAALTRRLIDEKGFAFVAVEGDWPDCYDISRWAKGLDGERTSSREALAVFQRWPTWMWANEEVAEFVAWLREHNGGRAPGDRVGFYGLDVYSLWDSLRALMEYVEEHEPDALDAARQAWQCFEPYAEDPQEYAWATRLVPTSCEPAVVELLTRMLEEVASRNEDPADDEARFDARQNAAVAVGAERYYRAMVRGGASSWNVRDTHMVDTLDRLAARHGPGCRAVVWEHNTHVGDARATDMAAAGMVNVGQLVRMRHPGETYVVGFGGHHGTVVAGRSWGAPWEVMPVPAARPDSHEGLIHQVTADPALFVFPDDRDGAWLSARRGHRAIGVVYLPGQDREGNWVPTVLGRRYDAFLSFDDTVALHPLELAGVRASGERETEPWGT